MNILHISTGHDWRGGERQLALNLQYLADDCSNVVVCAPGSPVSAYCRKNQITHFPLKIKNSIDLVAAIKLKGIIKSCHPDLIHLHDSKAHGMAVISDFLFGIKRPMVLSRRVMFNMSGSMVKKWKYNYPAIKKIICISSAIEEKLAPLISDRKKLITLYSGIELMKGNRVSRSSLKREFGLDSKNPIIGTLGALTAEKDHFTFINAASIIVKDLPHATFFIFGEGELREPLENHIKAQNLEGKVLLPGFRNNIGDYLQDFNLMLFTSRMEGLGSSLLDAMNKGIPIVATNTGGIPEMIISEKTGLLAEVGDAAGLARQCLRILSDEKLQLRIRANSKEHLVNFDIVKNTHKLCGIYKEIVEV